MTPSCGCAAVLLHRCITRRLPQMNARSATAPSHRRRRRAAESPVSPADRKSLADQSSGHRDSKRSSSRALPLPNVRSSASTTCDRADSLDKASPVTPDRRGVSSAGRPTESAAATGAAKSGTLRVPAQRLAAPSLQPGREAPWPNVAHPPDSPESARTRHVASAHVIDTGARSRAIAHFRRAGRSGLKHRGHRRQQDGGKHDVAAHEGKPTPDGWSARGRLHLHQPSGHKRVGLLHEGPITLTKLDNGRSVLRAAIRGGRVALSFL